MVDNGREAVLLDFGLNFARYQLLFEEFLRPRATRGLTDLFRFGLIPHLPGAYRRDLQIGGSEQDSGNSPQIIALLLTHAHVDHFGVMGVLDTDIPIHCTPSTMAILKASQDGGKADFWGESTYIVPRVPGDHRNVIKCAPTTTVSNGRPFVSLGPVSPDLATFMSTTSNRSPRARKLIPGLLSESNGKVGPFGYRHWSVDHSVLGCCAFEISDGEHRFMYSGDLRFHGARGSTSKVMVEDLAADPPDLLVRDMWSGCPRSSLLQNRFRENSS
jgi:ribonuclease J